MTMILNSEKLNPQYNQNSVLTMPWIAGTPQTLLATGMSSSRFLKVISTGG